MKLRLGLVGTGFGKHAVDEIEKFFQTKRFCAPRRGSPTSTLVKFLNEGNGQWRHITSFNKRDLEIYIVIIYIAGASHT